jgi:hypothetical protein
MLEWSWHSAASLSSFRSRETTVQACSLQYLDSHEMYLMIFRYRIPVGWREMEQLLLDRVMLCVKEVCKSGRCLFTIRLALCVYAKYKY